MDKKNATTATVWADVVKSFKAALTAADSFQRKVNSFRNDLIAYLPGGKFATKAEYTAKRRELTDAGKAAGKSDEAIRQVLTRAKFTLCNPDHKVRGRRTKAADAEKKAKAPSTTASTKLTQEETALLVAYRNHDVATIRKIADNVEESNKVARQR